MWTVEVEIFANIFTGASIIKFTMLDLLCVVLLADFSRLFVENICNIQLATFPYRHLMLLRFELNRANTKRVDAILSLSTCVKLFHVFWRL